MTFRIPSSGETIRLFVSPSARKVLGGGVLILILIWINAYICKQVFSIEYTGKMNSMHGVWIAMAKLATVHWYKPYWWPYWYLGMPFEYTYAPLVPGLTAAVSRLAHVSPARGFLMVSGAVYCFAPVALYLMARQLTGRRGWSFIAALAYSLTAGSEVLLPDTAYALRNWGSARRLYICFIWDEIPHQLGLALVCIAILFLARALNHRKSSNFVWAGLFVALSLLASAFGATGLALFAVCLLATCQTATWKRNILLVAITGFLGYLAMCPYFPPSLIQIVRANGQLFSNSAFTRESVATMAGVTAGGALLWFLSRRWRPWYMRFFLLLGWLTFIIPALDEKKHLHFLPQAGRYKVELELTFVLLVVFGAAVVVDRLPRAARVTLALLLIWPVYHQVVSYRRFSKNAIGGADMTETIEYQVARWIEPNLPGWRVLAPGSIAQWLNTFSKVPQFTGGSFPTAPNLVQLSTWWHLLFSTDAVVPVLWCKAYGVDAVIVAGENSPEFWKPHTKGHQFDGTLPVLWEAQDTRIYAVPRARTLAHVIPRDAAVWNVPPAFEDTAQVKRFVAAMEDADIPPAQFRWIRDGGARIHAQVKPGEVISVQVTYHPGWRATAAGQPVPVIKDGLGMIVLTPGRPGDYEIELLYGASWEDRICRILSVTTLLGIAIFSGRRLLSFPRRRLQAGVPDLRVRPGLSGVTPGHRE